MSCEVCEILPEIPPEYVLVDGQFWNANLRDLDQTLLGTSFITAKRHVSELDKLTPDEEQELIIIRNSIIKATRVAFDPLTFNVSCLKNDAFRFDPDSATPEMGHVHWHIKPRYTTSLVEFNGHSFQDPAPGRYLPLLKKEARFKPDHELATAIASAIRSNL